MPVIVRRATPQHSDIENFSAPIQTYHQPSPVNDNEPIITVENSAPSLPTSVVTETAPKDQNCYECDYNLPFYYYNPLSPLLNLLWLIILIIIIAIAIFILLNVLLGALMGIILFISPKSQRCKNCGKIFKYTKENKDRCPYCGAKIQDEIKPH